MSNSDMIHSMERRISFSLGGLLMDPIPIKYIFVSPKAVGFAVKKKYLAREQIALLENSEKCIGTVYS